MAFDLRDMKRSQVPPSLRYSLGSISGQMLNSNQWKEAAAGLMWSCVWQLSSEQVTDFRSRGELVLVGLVFFQTLEGSSSNFFQTHLPLICDL